MVPPVIPADKQVFIKVFARVCIVSRYRKTDVHEVYEAEEATNREALEEEARQAVEDLVGAVTEDGHFPCPEALAAKAEWQ